MNTSQDLTDNISPKIQIIKKKVDAERLSGKYYRRIRNSIKKSINSDADLLMIEIIPKAPIADKWILESFLALQREFTPILITPINTIKIQKEEIEEMEKSFNASVVMIGT